MFAPLRVDRDAQGPGGGLGGPRRPSLVETTGSPRFLGSPSLACRALSGPAGPTCPQPVHDFGRREVSTAFWSDNTIDPGTDPFEAPSHGPLARCLRFVARVAPGTSTQDSLPACWLRFDRAGLSPAGLRPRLSGSHRSSPSCRARLRLAHCPPNRAARPASRQPRPGLLGGSARPGPCPPYRDVVSTALPGPMVTVRLLPGGAVRLAHCPPSQTGRAPSR